MTFELSPTHSIWVKASIAPFDAALPNVTLHVRLLYVVTHITLKWLFCERSITKILLTRHTLSLRRDGRAGEAIACAGWTRYRDSREKEVRRNGSMCAIKIQILSHKALNQYLECNLRKRWSLYPTTPFHVRNSKKLCRYIYRSSFFFMSMWILWNSWVQQMTNRHIKIHLILIPANSV